jgi:hypothetical protein
MENENNTKSIKQMKVEAQLEMNRLRSQESAKDVASKYIGKYGLFYITLIVLIAVGSSAFLPEASITAVMTMIGGALVALITMLQGITGTQKKEEKPESKDEEYNALQEQVKILSEKMKETNLINAKLLYVNKIMNENDLSAEQKIKVLNAFDQATTVKEAKLIHSSLSEAFKVKTAKPKTTNIKESLGFASKAAGTSTRKEIIAEADQQVSRWQKLAGIKLN